MTSPNDSTSFESAFAQLTLHSVISQEGQCRVMTELLDVDIPVTFAQR